MNGKRSIHLDTDHSGLNKYLSSHDENFLLVEAEIRRMVQAAPRIVGERYSCMNPNFYAYEFFSFSWYSNNLQANKTVEESDSFNVAFSLKGRPVVGEFVGRNTELTKLAELMISFSTNNMRRKICLLHGIGGVGKSQLAVEFARKHQKKFSAIFWISGSTKEDLRGSIAALTQRLPQHQLPEMARFLSKNSAEDFDEMVKFVLEWFSRPSNNKWLLIFDNVDREYSAQSTDPEAFDLKEYLPEADHGSILITSRLTDMPRLKGSRMELEPFDELQGENLLNSIVGKPLAGRLIK